MSDLAHDDGALNGQLQVHKGEAHDGDDTLHPVNLLTQEDVHGGQRAHLLQARLHLQEWASGCEEGMGPTTGPCNSKNSIINTCIYIRICDTSPHAGCSRVAACPACC